jgi:opacity protein-like surface antigen
MTLHPFWVTTINRGSVRSKRMKNSHCRRSSGRSISLIRLSSDNHHALSCQMPWVAGLGASYALTQNWNVGVEWLHYDLGSSTVTGITVAPGAIVPGASISASQKFSGDLVRANVNFKLW